jgi:ornithine cyclodeaminase/alanine dehydrogenase-like protein (mu-crystallin family)
MLTSSPQIAHLDAVRLTEQMPILRAVAALEAALRQGVGTAPPRAHVAIPGGELLLMPASSAGGVGVKLVTINPANPARERPLINGLYVLFDAEALTPILTIDAAALTALRTAAVSALATSHLAAPGARRLMLFGAGAQARAHLDAMCAVRQIEELVVVGGSSGRPQTLVAEAQGRGLRARVGAPEDVRDAEIVCTCTTSTAPVFPGALLAAGAHVNAVGAYRADMRELDDDAVAAARIVVESEEAALAEAGDLLIPLRSGALDRSAIVADLAALVAGATVRTSPRDVTLFKSVGVAWEDLAIATAAAEAVASATETAT